ncbi:hypothetical protein [Sphingomonas elodea]|uniref:hypothetical protein n=1 Tax=Sphingomonas elodea TaxID=179878 RepID=UPI0002630CE2|nr:hypothetical protein [Sphingomonas elodea]
MRLISLAVVTATALASQAQAQDVQQGHAIVVTGSSLKETERQLRLCLSGQCDPRQDIDASLAHAENLFLAGNYAAARETLAKSVDRNERHRRTLPVEVSDLQRAYGRMVDVSGQPDIGRIVQIDALDSLKAGLGRKDYRVFQQRMLVADQFAQAGRIRLAEDMYGAVERKAASAGLPQVSAYALLRRAKLLGSVSQLRPAYRSQYRAALGRLEKLKGEELAQFRVAAAVLRAQDAARQNDPSKIDAIVATMDVSQLKRPYLIYAPVIELQPAPSRMPVSGAGRPAEWADVRVTVRPDGRVDGYEILRQSGGIDERLMGKVTDSIAHRRYTPYTPGKGKPLAYRVERFSFVKDWWTGENKMSGNSRVRMQNVNARLAWLDLTPEESLPASKSAGG